MRYVSGGHAATPRTTPMSKEFVWERAALPNSPHWRTRRGPDGVRPEYHATSASGGGVSGRPQRRCDSPAYTQKKLLTTWLRVHIL